MLWCTVHSPLQSVTVIKKCQCLEFPCLGHFVLGFCTVLSYQIYFVLSSYVYFVYVFLYVCSAFWHNTRLVDLSIVVRNERLLTICYTFAKSLDLIAPYCNCIYSEAKRRNMHPTVEEGKVKQSTFKVLPERMKFFSSMLSSTGSSCSPTSSMSRGRPSDKQSSS